MHPVIALAGLTKVYGTERNPLSVLHGIDFRIAEGEYVAITGPSGSGKSTLLNIIGCLDRPTAGEYRFQARDVAQVGDYELSRLRNRKIGFVFQSFQLLPHLTVTENIELPLFYNRVPPRQRRSRAEELATSVGLGHRLRHRPTELSGGECQRTAIARALANEPAILLADEPTGNLDSATSADILRLIGELHERGNTIVVITHDHAIAENAPRRIALKDGRIEHDSGNGRGGS